MEGVKNEKEGRNEDPNLFPRSSHTVAKLYIFTSSSSKKKELVIRYFPFLALLSRFFRSLSISLLFCASTSKI